MRVFGRVIIMKNYYTWDTTTKIYAGIIQCREQDRPANSTDIKPLPFQPMNEIVWNGESWEYQPMNNDEEK